GHGIDLFTWGDDGGALVRHPDLDLTGGTDRLTVGWRIPDEDCRFIVDATLLAEHGHGRQTSGAAIGSRSALTGELSNIVGHAHPGARPTGVVARAVEASVRGRARVAAGWMRSGGRIVCRASELPRRRVHASPIRAGRGMVRVAGATRGR